MSVFPTYQVEGVFNICAANIGLDMQLVGLACRHPGIHHCYSFGSIHTHTFTICATH